MRPLYSRQVLFLSNVLLIWILDVFYCQVTDAFGSITAVENVTQPTVNMLHVTGATANIPNVTLHQAFDSPEEENHIVKMLYNCSITNMMNITLYREVIYDLTVENCWNTFNNSMLSIKHEHWCDWEHIVSYYSKLQDCLETSAERLCLAFPNELAHYTILEVHMQFFVNCSLLSEELMDPPENILFGLIFAPICIIPFLVTLVVYKSNTSKPQT